MRYLLEQGVDKDKADKFGKTPLHWAAWKQHREIIKLLGCYGANLSTRDNLHRLPIYLAATWEMKMVIIEESTYAGNITDRDMEYYEAVYSVNKIKKQNVRIEFIQYILDIVENLCILFITCFLYILFIAQIEPLEP